jgi:hypothetical protein
MRFQINGRLSGRRTRCRTAEVKLMEFMWRPLSSCALRPLDEALFGED